jgi:hypothetical protein
MSGHETCVDWWTRAVIRVIDRGTLYAKYAHGGHEGQKMRPVCVKRGLYWRITRFRAQGEYMIRLDGWEKGRTHTGARMGGGLGLISLCSGVTALTTSFWIDGLLPSSCNEAGTDISRCCRGH